MTNSPNRTTSAPVDPNTYGVAVTSPNDDGVAHHSPSAARNTGVILQELARLAPLKDESLRPGHGLEIASGSGQHATAYAGRFPHITWTPSDPNPSARASINAWRDKANLTNLEPPLDINLITPDWHGCLNQPIDVVIAINVVHISSWQATLGLLEGANAALAQGGLLFIYSCFFKDGDPISQSNLEFDRSLRARNPEWGVRDTSEVIVAAKSAGLTLENVIAMPANNHALAFRK